jgi:hypothetical protein
VGRTIIVGDVHGCSAELGELVDRIGPGHSDRFVFVGDLVGRGPDSRGVLRLVRALGGSSVVGNHERKLLAVRAALERGQRPARLSAAYARLLDELSAADYSFLQSMPAYLELVEHGVCVVHAGVVPGVPIAAQQRRHLTTVRSVRADGTPSADSNATPWAELYRGPPHVVFGHNALARLQLYPDATGLDSGCVYGGELTALVLRRRQTPPRPAARRALLVSVAARRCYVAVCQQRGQR